MRWTKYENGRLMHRSLNPNIRLFMESMGIAACLFAFLWLLAAV